MQTVFKIDELRGVIDEWRHDGEKIAFVPTMGNLHAGHISLLARAAEIADRSVVSIFVNPIQFGKGEDYDGYPSTLAEDQVKLKQNNLDLLFVPDLSVLYPRGIEEDTRVTVPRLSTILCGSFRPDHFPGVATVVTKLFINVQPHYALFGEKDYQQLLVIKRMVSDLCMPVEVIGQPIVREPDGLAMSSRNAYLKPDERRKAPLIYATLCEAGKRLHARPNEASVIEKDCMEILRAAGLRPEYFCIRRSEDLAELCPGDQQLSILTAAWLGSARLIDNVKVFLDEPFSPE